MPRVYDTVIPEYRMLGAAHLAAEIGNHNPDVMISIGASALAYSIIVAAEERELAMQLKNNIFTLGWTEEHCGSDLLSVRTGATPMSDDPDERQYYIKGSKWIINCSYHADYHVVVAKVDPSRDDPRSLSFFLVPRSSTKNWERLETHILDKMVLTKFDIDGPGTLLGRVGHGLTILQRMAMPSKYQCTYMGVDMMGQAIPASIDHLSTKNIFGNNPIQFSNVFRQMYDLVLKSALYHFMYYRSVALDTDGWLQFHGTLLKSFLLLRINELLSRNLLIAGSKGFVATSPIGKSALDSFVLPVFDGHYTINTFMSEKFLERYLAASDPGDLEGRVALMRERMFLELMQGEMDARPRDLRKPPFFDYADYIQQMKLPIDLPAAEMIQRVSAVVAEIEQAGLSSEPEYRYKMGDLLHWMESVVAAGEMVVMSGEQNYVNAVVIQYNGLVNAFNNIVSEGGFQTEFLTPLRQLPIDMGDESDPSAFLLRLFDVRERVGLAAAAV